MDAEKYIKGFNSGYTLAAFKPTLAESVLKNVSITSEYLEGLVAGKEQIELEQNLDKLSEIEQLRNDKSSRDNSRDHDY
jgi:hypothetical protein